MAEDCSVWNVAYPAAYRFSGWTHGRLASALLQKSRGRYAGLVDSSKTAWGQLGSPFRLWRNIGPEFCLIHIVRDPRAVFWSVLKQKRRQAHRRGDAPPPERLLAIWTIVGWSAANLSCEVFRLLHPYAYVRVRYEDLARSPRAVLKEIYEKVLPNVRWDIAALGINDNRHQLHGNAMRYYPLSVADVNEDLSWKINVPQPVLRFIMPVSYPLRRRYGYR
jgi:hypothetical protein